MSNISASLPVVMQQAHDATRVQEAVQRTGEEQQVVVTQQMAQEEERNRSRIQKSQESGADNRVRTDDQSSRNKREQQSRRESSHKEASETNLAETGGGLSGSLVDVKV